MRIESINHLLIVSVSMWVSTLLLGCNSNIEPPVNNEISLESNANVQQEIKAYGRFVPERNDDFAWENDKVAFRVYGPSAPLRGHGSGVDAWFKKVNYSIIDQWYENHLNGISYHVDRGEGYDPYHTGTSRGVGSTAVWIQGQAYFAHSFKNYNIEVNNSTKVVFTLEYEWQTPLGLVHESKTVSLLLGSQLFSVNSVFSLDGVPTSLPIALGVTTHDEKASISFNYATGRISAWEEIDGLGVGTGALIAPGKITGIKHLPSTEKDKSHIWVFTKSNSNGTLEYQAGFAWAGAKEITSFEQWNQYLDKYKK